MKLPNGELANSRGFFHDAPKSKQGRKQRDLKKGPITLLQNKELIRYMVGFPSALNGYSSHFTPRHISPALCDYVRQKGDLISHPTGGFKETLRNYVEVMRNLKRLIAKAEKGSPGRKQLEAIQRRAQTCGTEPLCRLAFCPICVSEHKLGLLDMIAATVAEGGPIPRFRFVTLLGDMVYGSLDEVEAAVQAFQKSIRGHFDQGRRDYPELYKGLRLVLATEVDIVLPFHSLAEGVYDPQRNYQREWECSALIGAAKKQYLINSRFDPNEERHGFLITCHGLLMADTDEQIEALRSRMTSPNVVNGTALFGRHRQVLFKRLYRTQIIRHSINIVIGYAFKNLPRSANYIVSNKALKKRGYDLKNEGVVPIYRRILSESAMEDYILLSERLSLQQRTQKMFFRGSYKVKGSENSGKG